MYARDEKPTLSPVAVIHYPQDRKWTHWMVLPAEPCGVIPRRFPDGRVVEFRPTGFIAEWAEGEWAQVWAESTVPEPELATYWQRAVQYTI